MANPSDDFATGVGKASRDTLLGESHAQAVKRMPVGASVAHSLDDNTRGHMLKWLKCAKLDKPAFVFGKSLMKPMNSLCQGGPRPGHPPPPSLNYP